jgi:hypothetical protein
LKRWRNLWAAGLQEMRHIEKAQIVQGVLERRIEERIDSLAAAAETTNRRRGVSL